MEGFIKVKPGAAGDKGPMFGSINLPFEFKYWMSVVRTFGAVGGVNQRSLGLVFGLMLSGALAVKQAAVFDGLSFDPFTLFEDGLGPAAVGIGGGHVA